MYRGNRNTSRDGVAPLVTCDQSDFRLYLDISKEFLIMTGGKSRSQEPFG